MRSKAISLLLLCAAAPSLASCGGSWGWYVVDPMDTRGRTNLEFLASGFWNTIWLSIDVMLVSIVLGVVVGILAMSSSGPLRAINRVYVEILRSVPPIVMLLWAFYGLPIVIGLKMSVFTVAVLAIAICDSAFMAEIFRGGIQSIDRGQHEAAYSIGLTWHDKMRYIILPLAVRRILPPLGNQFVYVVKMSSLASVIGFEDLTRKSNELVVTVFRPLEYYTILILEYLVLILVISYLVRWMERTLGSDEGGRRDADLRPKGKTGP